MNDLEIWFSDQSLHATLIDHSHAFDEANTRNYKGARSCRAEPVKGGRRRYRQWGEDEKVEIVAYADVHGAEEAGKKFDVASSMVRRWLNEIGGSE